MKSTPAPRFPSAAPASMPAIGRGVVMLMAFAAGTAVANLYYVQPLLAQMARDLKLTPVAVGLVVTWMQAGYSLGVLLIVPLGDVVERRALIARLAFATALLLLGIAAAPSIAWISVAGFAMGAATIAPQILVPFAADLAAPWQRGRVIGTVTSGLLLGVLLSRFASGAVGASFGWRAVFVGAAVLNALVGGALRFLLPAQEPATSLPYSQLLRSLAQLLREEPALRLHVLLGALTFAGFSAFWATLAVHLDALPGHHGPRVAGFYGLVGLMGALAAPLVGRYSDRRGDRWVNGVAIALLLAAFAVFAAFGNGLLGLAMGVLLLDLGVQANHVSNQTRIVALREGARSRLNTIYICFYIGGGALGSLAGTLAFRALGFLGVCLVGGAAGSFALLRLFVSGRPVRKSAFVPVTGPVR